MISNCGKSETGSVYGEPGDQTRQEYWNIPWWNDCWTCVFRHPKVGVRNTLANYAKNAADNDNIGYCQSTRLTMWQQISFLPGRHDPALITARCNADCSSSTMAIIRAVGLDLQDRQLACVPVDWVTGQMIDGLQQYGFQKLTDRKYLTGESELLAGDILMNEGHACIVVTGRTTESEEPKETEREDQTTEYKNPQPDIQAEGPNFAEHEIVGTPVSALIVYMSGKFPIVRRRELEGIYSPQTEALQALMKLRGYGSELEVTGIFDTKTENAIEWVQRIWALTPDLEAGTEVWTTLINNAWKEESQ